VQVVALVSKNEELTHVKHFVASSPAEQVKQDSSQSVHVFALESKNEPLTQEAQDFASPAVQVLQDESHALQVVSR
jgi:DNA polymerase III psi subunit